MAIGIKLRRFLVDLACLIIVWIPVLLFAVLGKPFQRGFFCDDDSIRHPYHDGTISNIVLYIIGVGLPISAMVVVELCRVKFSTSKRSPSGRASAGFKCGSLQLSAIVADLWHVVVIFLFGAGCSQVATDIGKYSIGRLRPHFLDICKPDLEKLCTLETMHTYIEDFTCLNPDVDPHRLREARLSFPSGHSSFSAYTMLYLAIYLQARMTWSGSDLLRPLLQLVSLMMAWYTGMSRVSDYKHHWSDVLSGFLIGLIAASLTGRYVSSLFRSWDKNHRQQGSGANNGIMAEDHRDINLTAMENGDSQ